MQQNRTSYLGEWSEVAKSAATGHARAAVRLRRRGWQLGVPAAALAAVVGTTVFATLEENVNLYIRLAVAIVSLSAAVLSTLQSALRFPERAEHHRTAAAEYRSIEREIRAFLADYDASDRDMTDEQAKQAIALIRKRLDELEARAPELVEIDQRPEQKREPPIETSNGRLKSSA